MTDTLRLDASGIRIRRIDPSDSPELERFYAALSDESRAFRFLACTSGLSSRQSSRFCSTDHDHREGFVALSAGSVVGHLCLEPTGEASVELAVAVADVWQRRGIGRRLVSAALDWARLHRISRISATMRSDNVSIHRLVASLGVPVHVHPVGVGTDVMTITLDTSARAAA